MHPAPPHVRRRLIGVLFAGTAFARTGFIAAVTVAPLVAEDLLGSATLSGLPTALATVGVAAGTAPIASLMARRGRRVGIVAGFGVSAAGVLIAALAIVFESFPLFAAGMLGFGVGAAGDRLARYAAADVSAPERRSFAISVVVWAGTIGSVLGPVLLEPVASIAASVGLNELAGAPLLAAAGAIAGMSLAFTGLRPDPLSFVTSSGRSERTPWRALRPQLARPEVRYAIGALLIGQVVMVLIMAMTPVYIRRAGEDLGIVGLVIGAHTFGMFALSPLTGLVSDRYGRLPVMVAGQGVLILAALLAAGARGDDRGMLVVSLFLLGVGWNLGFVAGSAYLTEGAPVHLRVPLQGVADTVVWASGAAASLSSGILLEASSFAVLCVTGAALVVVPLAMLARYRRALLAPATS